MSSTRHAPEDDELRQQHWASDPEFSTSISALLAAKRIALIPDRGLRDLLWFIQWRSLEPRGLRRLAQEIIEKFPGQLGTATMRRLHLKPGKKLSRSETVKIRSEFPGLEYDFPLKGEAGELADGGWVDVHDPAPESYRSDDFIAPVSEAAERLHERLMQLCLDPSSSFDRDPWYFGDVLGALRNHRCDCGQATAVLASTESTRQINSTLDFCFRRRRMVLIEGKAGIGKSETLKAWCNRNAGLARYVEVPSSNDDRSFFAALAGPIGVARGTSYNGQQIKLRVEEALRASGLMLVLDEAQFLWPQYIRPQGIPSRIQWVKTQFDAGTPIALVGLPKFSEWQTLYSRRTLWDDDQLERRLNRKVVLPDTHSQEDLLSIARVRHPGGCRASWKLLVGYAMAATKKQASAITEALESAIDLAHQDGRDSITYDDIYSAVKLDFKPFATPLHKATKGSAAHARAHLARSHTSDAVSRCDGRIPTNRHTRLAAFQTADT